MNKIKVGGFETFEITDDFSMDDVDFSELDEFCEKLDLPEISVNIKQNIYIGALMKSLENELVNKFNTKIKELNLTSSQFDIIIFLMANDDREINQKDIEHQFNLKNPTVTGLLKRLEAKGFVERYTSEHDARYKRIVLTDKVRRIKKLMHNSLSERAGNLLENVTEEEKVTFIKVLLKMNKNAHNHIIK